MNKTYVFLFLALFLSTKIFSIETVGEKIIIYDTLFSWVSEYKYVTGYTNEHFSNIKSPKNAKRYIVNDIGGLNVAEFVYSAKIGFVGNDTAIINSIKYDSVTHSDTLVFVFNCKPFDYPQNHEFQVKYITNNSCTNVDDGYIIFRKQQKYADSVVISGLVEKDCCGFKNIFASYNGDTIIIIEKYKFGGCACVCGFPYSFTLPLKGNERFIKYADETVPLSSGVVTQSSRLKLSPKPASHTVEVSTDLKYDKIEIYSSSSNKVMESVKTTIIDVSFLASGGYTLVILLENKAVTSKLFVKE